MFESISHEIQGPKSWPPVRAYAGPERRARRAGSADWQTRIVDEFDHGVLVVGANAQVIYLNHAARQELDAQHPLQLVGKSLRAQRPQDLAPLFDALAGAQRGRRTLVKLGNGEQRISVSVVPLAEPGSHAPWPTLLTMSKRQMCAKLSVENFARSLGLTPAETRVLEQLCNGVSPKLIAERAEVEVCTVRTQIGSIRAKAAASSIRELVLQVAMLPPMVSALRHGFAATAGQ